MSELQVNTINEVTAANGVTIDGLSLKDGNVVPAAGKGIDFSAASGSASGSSSALLDDYEEGTFTPSARNESGSASKHGVYTKIGNMCHFKIHIFNLGSTGGSLEFNIRDLPFTGQNNSNVEASCAVGPLYKIDSPTGHMQLGAKVSSNNNYIYFYWGNDDTVYTIATCANFDTSDCSILISGSYQTT